MLTFRQSQPATVTVLDGSDARAGGTILDLDGKLLTMTSGLPIDVGTLVRVEWEQCLVLGEVIASEPADSTTNLTVLVEHALEDLAALEEQRRQWAQPTEITVKF